MWPESSWLAPSWRHEGAVIWRRHDVMGAPSCGALLTSWRRRHVAPSWRHGDSVMWRRHDVMRAPSGGAPMTSWGIVRSGEAFGQFSKPDWVSTVMSFEYLDNWQPKWNIANLSQQKVKVKLDFIITQNKCSDLFLSRWYHYIVRMNVIPHIPWSLSFSLFFCRTVSKGPLIA